ncbi:MAG: phosphoethanolamine--lipid A transferase [Rickettsiales bacterium]|nr:phosphoethanolamine--lipid A transferase [Rickettsiales bacterium]
MLKSKMRFLSFVVLYSIATIALYNITFWDKIIKSFSVSTTQDAFFIIQFALILITLHIVFYSIIFVKPFTKSLSIILLYINAAATYFISHYGISIDYNMITNVLNTDLKEASDLLSFYLLGYIVVLGLIPHIIIVNATIIYQSFWKEVLQRIVCGVSLIIICLGMILFNYKELSIFIRSNKDNLGYLIPRNYLYSIIKLGRLYFKQDLKTHTIGEDAKNNSQDKMLVVLIIGEAARKHNFSLYGYTRETNPHLKKIKNLVVFNNTTSCGTSTAVSLPCIFSYLDREHFIKNSKQYEFLPSLLSKQNIDVTWIENNFGGCKKTCNNVKTINTQHLNIKEFCDTGECVDGILVDQFEKQIKISPTQNTVIVLHQNGSHGPKYNKRYPKEFEKFKPVCTTTNLSKCSKEELINAYDNTILYTDYTIYKVITKLNSMPIPSLVMYISDHGESLGEYNIYLHGFPYMIAPKEQKEIPFLMWLSPSLSKKINLKCLNQKSSYSHDNIFHSILGIFNISTSIYKKSNDIFADCQK